jgi:hypothetical protein
MRPVSAEDPLAVEAEVEAVGGLAHDRATGQPTV